MSLKHLTCLTAAAALSVVAVPSAVAIPLHYEIAGGSVLSNTSESGLIIQTSLASGLSGTAFTLDDGQSSGWFNFFKIWTPESDVGADDVVEKAISATLTFSDPAASATVSGTTVGQSFWGIWEQGSVEWSAPKTVVLGDRTFTVTLSPETFNGGLFGLNPPPAKNKLKSKDDEVTKKGGKGVDKDKSKKDHPSTEVWVKAKIKQVTSQTPTEVPDASHSVILLGMSFVALALFRRIRPAKL